MSAASRDPPRSTASAVLFRLLLAFPVLILTNWVGAGVILVLIALWLCDGAATGRMPGTPALALAGLIRFQARTYGYVMLLATAYPTGLFGDREPQGLARTRRAAGARPRPPRPPASTCRRPRKVVVVVCIVLGARGVVREQLRHRFDTRLRGVEVRQCDDRTEV